MNREQMRAIRALIDKFDDVDYSAFHIFPGNSDLHNLSARITTQDSVFSCEITEVGIITDMMETRTFPDWSV